MKARTKILSIGFVAGFLVLGNVSVEAQSRLAGRTFVVAGSAIFGVTPIPVEGQVSFGLFNVAGAYWDEAILFSRGGGMIAVLSAGAQYVEIPLGPTESLLIAGARTITVRIPRVGDLPVPMIDLFYVWSDGERLHFTCIPMVDASFLIGIPVPIGLLMGTEVLP